MRIVASSVELASAHVFVARSDVTERITAQVRPASDGSSGCDRFHHDDSGSDKLDRMLDKLGRLLEAQKTHDSDRLEARIARLVDRIRSQYDHEVGPNAPSAADAVPADGTRVDLSYRRTERYQEAEATSFRATGTVTTSDGRQIDFSQALDLARAFARTDTTALRASVIVPAGTTSGAVPSAAQAPVPSDGTSTPASATPGSPAAPPSVPTQALTLGGSRVGLDRNGDGVIDPATELLGASGAGFDELQSLDADHNGFIDEADPAFASLRLVSADSTETLAAGGVGALYTGSVATPFRFTDPTGNTLGNLSRTGLYLSENGGSGLLQQVDFTA